MGGGRSRCHLQLLGAFTYSEAGAPRALRPTCRRLLALVATRGPIARAEAAGILWPDVRQEKALGNLRTVLWRLRRDGVGAVCETADVLHLRSEVTVDLSEALEWAHRGLEDIDPWMPIPRNALAELLPGWGDRWLIETREQTRLNCRYAVEAVAQRLMMAGRFGEAASVAQAVVTADPLRESANRLLVEIFLREGNRRDALRHYERLESLLWSELGALPEPALTALVASMTAAPEPARPRPRARRTVPAPGRSVGR